jgi:predicted RNase H-like nuclease (RuvC/YqgF family)
MQMAKDYTTFITETRQINEYDEVKMQKEIEASDKRIKKIMADLKKRDKRIEQLQKELDRIKSLSGDELRKEYDKRMKSRRR